MYIQSQNHPRTPTHLPNRSWKSNRLTKAPSIMCPYYFLPIEIAIFLPPFNAPLEGFRLTSVGLTTRFELRESRSISSSCSSESLGRFSLGGFSEGGLDVGLDELEGLVTLESSVASYEHGEGVEELPFVLGLWAICNNSSSPSSSADRRRFSSKGFSVAISSVGKGSVETSSSSSPLK